VGKVLDSVGPKKFFSSPDEEVKKAREGFAAYFFTLAMKKYTGKDWWLAHPDQADRSYPDFDFISFSENPNALRIEPVELTGFYPHFKSFGEALKVVRKKQKQYGTEAVKFSLLIFVNHEKSEEWVKLLRQNIPSEYPFLSIWTIHLLFKKGGQEVGRVIAERIMPLPGLRIEADTDDPRTHQRQPLPSYMEQRSENGTNYVTFRKDFINRMKSLRGEPS
jgi:hypothetical protein